MQRILLSIFFVVLLITNSNTASGQINKNYVHYLGQELIIEEKYNSAIDVLNVLLRADNTSADAYFLRGIAKYNLGDYIGAEGDFTKAIEINSVYTMAYHYRAIARSLLGNYEDSLTDFAHAIDIRPDNEGLYYSRGVTFFFNQQFKEAISDFNHFLRRKPNTVDAYVNRGTSYLMLKDTVNAFKDYDRAVKTNVYDPAGYLRRGILYFQQKKYENAFKDLTETINLDSLNMPAYFNRALVHAAQHRPLNAISDFNKVIKIDSSNSLTYFNRALLLSQIGDYNKAMEDYNMVEKLSPQNVLIYFNRGALNNQLGNVEEAENDFTKAIELYPDFANAYMNRSNVRYRMGRMAESKTDHDIAQQKIKEYREKMSDSTFSVYADTSKVFSSLLSFDVDFGNKDFKTTTSTNVTATPKPMSRFTVAKVQDSFNEVLVYDNKDIQREETKLRNIGISLSGLYNQLSDSEIDLKQHLVDSLLIEAKGEDATLYFAKGVLQHSKRQYTNAITNYTKAIELEPNNPFYYMNRAIANTEMTEFVKQLDNQNQRFVIDDNPVNQLKNTERRYSFDAAFRDINMAIRLNPNIAQFHYNKGYILSKNDDLIKAIESYSKAIELFPQMIDAYFNRGIIQIKLNETRKGFLDISRAGELGDEDAYQIIKTYGNLLNENDN